MKITYEDFRNGRVLRNGLSVVGTSWGDWYRQAVYEEIIGVNDDAEMAFTDQGSMNPYEIYQSKPYLDVATPSPCSGSVGGVNGNEFIGLGVWMANCPIFNS